MSENKQLKAGDTFANRYKIVKLLGAGGMGEVYLVEDSILDNELQALKILKKDLCTNEIQIKRFLQEVQLTRKVVSSNVVKTFEVNKTQDTLYFTMEYVEGESLKEVLDSSEIDNDKIVEIMLGIASGLEAIHEAKIIHRDLKPGNIMITTDGSIKIADFGVARTHQSDLTAYDEVVGSSLYMSPEAWKGKDITTKSDIYSLGVLLYKMLTKISPFDGETSAEIMYKHLEGKYVAPNQIDENIPTWLNKLTLKMLEVDPNNRISSAKEVIQEINFGKSDGNDSSYLETTVSAKPEKKSKISYTKRNPEDDYLFNPETNTVASSFVDAEKRIVNPNFGKSNIKQKEKNEKVSTKLFSSISMDNNYARFLLGLIPAVIFIYLLTFPVGRLLESFWTNLLIKDLNSNFTKIIIFISNTILYSLILASPLFIISNFYNKIFDSFFAYLKLAFFFSLVTVIFTTVFSTQLLFSWNEIHEELNFNVILVNISKTSSNTFQNLFEAMLLIPEGTFYKSIMNRGLPDFIEVGFSSLLNVLTYYSLLIFSLAGTFIILTKDVMLRSKATLLQAFIIVPMVLCLWIIEMLISGLVDSSTTIGSELGVHYFSFNSFWINCSVINWLFVLFYMLVILPRLIPKNTEKKLAPLL